MPTGR
jgi:hypothetical protein